MTTRELTERLALRTVAGQVRDGDGFSGVYVGDFLSRAMSHVKPGNLWITIMTNANVAAVATLTEPAAVILAEGVVLTPDARTAAEENGVLVLSSEMTAYELCTAIDGACRCAT